jgi:hypothetical protein
MPIIHAWNNAYGKHDVPLTDVPVIVMENKKKTNTKTPTKIKKEDY